MEFFRQSVQPFLDALNYPIFELGDAKTQITPLRIITLIFLIGLLIYLSGKVRRLLVEKVLVRTHLDIGARQAIGTISRYLLLFLGLLIILQTVGINLTTLNVVAGAIGIGVGFGLQNIASNFISGLIILTERPVKVGDLVEINGIDGMITIIGARSTKVKTIDDAVIIVPNSKFISDNVVNWSFDSKVAQFHIPVDVAYDSDIDLVEEVLLRIAAENPEVLNEPKPSVRLKKFDGGTLNLELWVWSESKLQSKNVLLSDLNFAIVKEFHANNIEVPEQEVSLGIPNDYELKPKTEPEKETDEAEVGEEK